MPRESEGLKQAGQLAWAAGNPGNRGALPDALRREGWGPEYSTGTDVQRQRWNQLFHEITSATREIENQGVVEWHSAVSYRTGAVVRRGRVWYRATADSLNSDPVSGSEWERMFQRTPSP